MFFNNLELVDLKTINKYKSPSEHSLLLIKTHPVVIRILEIAKTNMVYAVYFLIKLISLSYEIDVNDKILINNIAEL